MNRAAWLFLALALFGCAAAPSGSPSTTPTTDATGTPAASITPEAIPTPGFGEWAPDLLAAWELHQLSLTISDEAQGGHIDRAAAIAAGGHEAVSPTAEGVNVDAFLVRATSGSRFVDGKRMVDRPLWIVRLTGPGVHIPSGAPAPAPGMPSAPPRFITAIYVFVDADSGAFLFSRSMGETA